MGRTPSRSNEALCELPLRASRNKNVVTLKNFDAGGKCGYQEKQPDEL